MLSFEDEYDRVVSNPDNVILSEGLEEILGASNSTVPGNSDAFAGYIMLSEKEYVFDLKKIKRTSDDTFVFKGLSPAFPLNEFVAGENFVLFLFNASFELDEDAPVIYKSDGILTFTAKRIINNETVSV